MKSRLIITLCLFLFLSVTVALRFNSSESYCARLFHRSRSMACSASRMSSVERVMAVPSASCALSSHNIDLRGVSRCLINCRRDTKLAWYVKLLQILLFHYNRVSSQPSEEVYEPDELNIGAGNTQILSTPTITPSNVKNSFHNIYSSTSKHNFFNSHTILTPRNLHGDIIFPSHLHPLREGKFERSLPSFLWFLNR